MQQIVKAFLIINYSLLIINSSKAQLGVKKESFTHADTLRGTYGPARDWWDALKYDLNVKFNLDDSTISGSNTIQFKILKKQDLMQIDLQEPMVLDGYNFSDGGKYPAKSISQAFKKDGNAYYLALPDLDKYLKAPYKKIVYVKIFFHGKPRVAVRPPWDGGVMWKKDKNKNSWISVACQGLGASVWYPCKDHQADEPDSAEMHITCPDTLVCVGNGRFRGRIDNHNGTATYDWAVANPINNYCIIPYIGKYVHFGEGYKGEKGNLDMDYWVMDYDLDKAKEHFKDAKRMMEAFEHWFGPYPFYEDGYKLVEAPHLGMEHQSATAYGNRFMEGYLGNDVSGSGWGLKWDFIIVHESGHEWFANNITSKDIADMWIHEGFTSYSETLFTEYFYGKEAGNEYNRGIRKNIVNKNPIISAYGVNKESETTDMYYKAANMLHTIRQAMDNDSLFRQVLRGLNQTFYHQTVTSKQVEGYMSWRSGMNLSKVFDQYLRAIDIPVLEYKIEGSKFSYHYTNCVKGFNLPLKVHFKKDIWLKPTDEWKVLELASEGASNFGVDPNFYIKTKKITD